MNINKNIESGEKYIKNGEKIFKKVDESINI